MVLKMTIVLKICLEDKSFPFGLCLNEFGKNLASSLEQSLSNHCYGDAFSSDRPILFAMFPQSFAPFMNYPS
jgi:hypothetical protein